MRTNCTITVITSKPEDFFGIKLLKNLSNLLDIMTATIEEKGEIDQWSWPVFKPHKWDSDQIRVQPTNVNKGNEEQTIFLFGLWHNKNTWMDILPKQKFHRKNIKT